MKLSPLALAATVVLGLGSFAGVACAQSVNTPVAAPAVAPQFAPAQTRGVVTHYVVGPMGHVRGFQLDNGAVVFVGGRAGDAMSQQVPVGQSVSVAGFVAGGNAQMIRHATVTAANGSVVAAPRHPFDPAAAQQRWAQRQQQMQPGAGGGGGFFGHHPGGFGGGGHRGEMRARMQAELAQLPVRNASGTVHTVLSGPRGRVNGVLLADGTSVFFAGPMARAVNQRGIRAGESISVAGRGNAYPQGASVMAEQVHFADGGTINAPMGAAQPTP